MLKSSADLNMQTSVKNLFAAGDGAGLSRDIINASATGVLAGRGILNFLRR
ncbi:MAG: FAD-dependent oxidoreductase, partial [Candidatus Methanoperedens sp.]|nr:FAD-dependent oxidoreductase [Candidatus Methanoperedens sp.]